MQKILLAALVVVFGAGAVLAQAPPPPPAAAAPAAGKPKPKVTAAPKERTPESIECSKQADAKGLHGKERVHFRANCKSKLLKQKKS